MNRLNGWIRLGLLFSVIWALLVLAVAGYEYVGNNFRDTESVFVYRDLAKGTEWVGEGDPWDHDWESDPNAEKVTVVRFRKLLVWVIGPIVGAWLFVVGLIFSVRWVGAGFNTRGDKQDKSL